MSIGDVHVTPIADLIAHEMNEDCPCGPQPEFVSRDDGSTRLLYKHHSLDGREEYRRNTKGPCINNPMCQCGCDDGPCPDCPGDEK